MGPAPGALSVYRATVDQFAGCFIGQCLGDALGFAVEGRPPGVCRRCGHRGGRRHGGCDLRSAARAERTSARPRRQAYGPGHLALREVGRACPSVLPVRVRIDEDQDKA
jgi:hypothetical protein